MPAVAVKCPYCDAAASLAFGQVAPGCDLRWWESLSCRACGTRTEADGGEAWPQERRAVLLEQEGHGSAIAEGQPTQAVLRSARGCLRLSVGGLSALKARRPGRWLGARGPKWRCSPAGCVARQVQRRRCRWAG